MPWVHRPDGMRGQCVWLGTWSFPPKFLVVVTCERSEAIQLRQVGSRAARIVRAFARDGDVVDMAFAKPGAGDAYELGLAMEVGQIARADIPHRRAQSPGELMHHIADRPLVRHLALDALGHELERVLDVLLKIAIGRAA